MMTNVRVRSVTVIVTATAAMMYVNVIVNVSTAKVDTAADVPVAE